METKKNLYRTITPLLLFFIFFFFFNAHLSLSSNSISANQSLSGDQTIVSSGGIFELGFCNPGNSSSNNYIGIWYKKVSLQTIVWVANREKPISDKFSSSLRISGNNLVLYNESKVPIWFTNLNDVNNSTNLDLLQAVLRDDGNLVLQYGSSNSTRPLWQSFDYPTDTWLPGGKISYNKITKQSQLLTSWKNRQDPSQGLFSLELDPNGTGAYFIFWNRSMKYWTSGPWNGQIFSLVPEMRSNFLYDFSFVSNDNESYFTYDLYNPSIISRFVMDISGQIKQYTWLDTSKQWNLFWSQPREQCEVYAFCGAFGTCTKNSLPFCKCLDGFNMSSSTDWNLADYSSGCVRKTDLKCGNETMSNGDDDKFSELSSTTLPEHPQSVNAGTQSECESICLNRCSCIAYAYDNSGGCMIWNGDLLNLQQLDEGDAKGKTLHVKLAASEFLSSKNNKGMIIGVVVGSIVGIIILLGLVLFVVLRSRKRAIGKGRIVEGSLLAFRYRDLQNATKNFSEKLGGGGFGSVFKGTLSDSNVVAVKKLDSVTQGEKQFRTEVSTIGTIQHVNLVRLRGFCSEGTKKLLVYEYMPNGSLNSHLFPENNNSRVLDWKTRYQIALGTARGLAYLHEKCRDCIIHCDIKPENILLDAEFCPKVSDFGLAKLVGREFSRVLTTMRGTRGYLAPEWISGLAITAKADVFSYGMMLFELISGRRNSEFSADGKVKFFPIWVANVITTGGDVWSLLDPRLKGNDVDIDEVVRACKVACWCIQDEESYRPSMGHVAQILEGLILELNLPPIPRSLLVFGEDQDQIVFFTESSTSSRNSQVKSSNTSNASSSHVQSAESSSINSNT